MSKELVARALTELAIDGEESTAIQRAIDASIANLIRAVDALYPDGYDEVEGFELWCVNGPQCSTCFGSDKGHHSDCKCWNTRVALLALCRDITGEKG